MRIPHFNPKAWKLVAAALSLGIAVPAAFAQTATVRSMALLSTSGPPEIEVKTSAPISPATQAVVGPDRIVIDFPGALPADTLKKFSVHRGGLQRVRAALYQSSPPITRVVLDVDGPTDYQVVPNGNSVIIKLVGPSAAAKASAPGIPQPIQSPVPQTPVQTSIAQAPPRQTPPAQFKIALATPMPSPAHGARLTSASLPALQVVNTVSASTMLADATPIAPPRPKVDVGVRSNLLSVRAQGATLAEVLYEIHRRTGADIAIPAGAEQEKVVVNIPSAPGRDVIASLLNGSRFNYIVLGTDSDPGGFRNLLLSVKEGGGGGNSGIFVHNTPPPGSQPPAMQPAPVPDQPQDPSQVDPAGVAQAAPELEPIPDEAPPAEPEANPENPRQPTLQQPTIQNVPEAGQIPQ